jgi:hypothetical protein
MGCVSPWVAWCAVAVAVRARATCLQASIHVALAGVHALISFIEIVEVVAA